MPPSPLARTSALVTGVRTASAGSRSRARGRRRSCSGSRRCGPRRTVRRAAARRGSQPRPCTRRACSTACSCSQPHTQAHARTPSRRVCIARRGGVGHLAARTGSHAQMIAAPPAPAAAACPPRGSASRHRHSRAQRTQSSGTRRRGPLSHFAAGSVAARPRATVSERATTSERPRTTTTRHVAAEPLTSFSATYAFQHGTQNMWPHPAPQHSERGTSVRHGAHSTYRQAPAAAAAAGERECASMQQRYADTTIQLVLSGYPRARVAARSAAAGGTPARAHAPCSPLAPAPPPRRVPHPETPAQVARPLQPSSANNTGTNARANARVRPLAVEQQHACATLARDARARPRAFSESSNHATLSETGFHLKWRRSTAAVPRGTASASTALATTCKRPAWLHSRTQHGRGHT